MKNILYSIIIALFFHACNLGTTQVYLSDNISSQTQKEIEKITENFYNAILQEDEIKLKSLLSLPLLKELEKSNIQPLSVCKQLIDSASIANKRMKLVDEFYLKGSSNTAAHIPHQITRSEDYTINLKVLTNEAFILLQKVNSTRQYEILLTFSYGKFNDGWKINYIHGGDYSFCGLTAPNLYQKALEEYEKGYLINAYINVFLTDKNLHPGGKIFKYNIEKEVIDFQSRLMTEINGKYSFPITVEEIESKPQFYQILPQEIEDTYSPMVHYLTKINLSDTLQLRLEYEKIKDLIPKYFNGINNNQYVCYKAFNKIPEANETVDTYGFVHHINKEG